MSCPFYGFHLAEMVPPAMLAEELAEHGFPKLTMVSQMGNQCAIVRTAYAPCRMEVRGQGPDWQTCELGESVRLVQRLHQIGRVYPEWGAPWVAFAEWFKRKGGEGGGLHQNPAGVGGGEGSASIGAGGDGEAGGDSHGPEAAGAGQR